MRVLSLFDGMSCGRIALDKLDVDCEYYAAEIDKYATKVSEANYPDIVRLGDVTKWKEWDINWDFDLVLAGSPCQGFSFAGKQLAFDDPRSALFFTFVDILNHIKTINPDVKFLLENVRMKKEYLNVISKQLNVQDKVINSDLFTQQNRVRHYWFNWQCPDLPSRPNWEGKFYQWRRTYFRKNVSGVCPCLTANMGTGGHNVPLKSKNLKDKLTPIECERLQTVPDNYTNHVSNTQRYKMLGNGWTVDVIAYILKATLKTKQEDK
jgi:site-specific DNA-cytosine methylase